MLFPIILAGCLEPYQPPTVKESPDFLVVNGFLNSKKGEVNVTLSHTVALNSIERPAAEQNAEVFLQEESGASYNLLPSTTAGTYLREELVLSTEKRYRLFIQTASGKEYESDYISLTQTPEIDSISYSVLGDELEIFVNTHDPTGKSTYYRWNYIETWEYEAQYNSGWIIKNGKAEIRQIDEDIQTCWRTDPLQKIIIGTSNLLSQDVIRNFRLTTIKRGSLKISQKFSILVQQQTLEENAYNYWLNLQKTTESLGGLFDPMPSQVVGNIHSTKNPNEEVIGYFSGGSVSEKRIFIGPGDLPENFTRYLYDFCELDTIDVADIPNVTDPNALISAVYSLGFPVIIGYTTSESTCRDCRAMAGGENVRPEFWE